MKFFWIFFALISPGFAADLPRLGDCDVWKTHTAQPKGVMVVAHGMNLKPERMDELATFFAEEGYEVLRPAFAGHCNDEEKYLQVTEKDWEQDARRIHALAARRAAQLKKPLLLTAYSFSAAIFQSMSEELPFAQRIYFAPALSTKFWYPLLVWSANLFPNFTYQSKNLPGYYANGTSGMRPFLAMDAFLKKWKRGSGTRDSAPILAWIDENDELLSYDGLITIAADKNNWRIEKLNNKASTHETPFHHLIIDEAALGKEEWSRVKEETKKFLNSGR